MMLNRLLRKLLSRNLNGWQMAGFVLANLFGMIIVLTAVQFSTDVIPLFTGGDSFMKPGRIVVVKHVSAARTVSGKAPVFKSEEIDELEAQPFAKDVGTFIPSQFSVFASIGSQSMGMAFSTEMFFESIPDKYMDIDLSKWQYTAGSDTLPIVLPRTYLNLYNFGFAGSRGLPTLSEGVVGIVRINLLLSGSYGRRAMVGRVVAFSKRLNTILVPEKFMKEANAQLAPDKTPQPSRLIVTVTNPGDERITEYLASNNYEAEGGDDDASRTAGFLRVIAIIVMVIGLVISALAFYVLLLSIYLLLQKHTEKIDNLLLIGYSPLKVSWFYYTLAIGLNLLVFIVALFLTFQIRKLYLPYFGELYPRYEASEILPTVLVGTSLFLLVSILNFLAVRRKVMRVWQLHKV